MLCVVRCVLLAVHCSLFVSCLLVVDCCLLHVVRCSSSVACVLFVVLCLLGGVCWLSLGVC